MSAPDDAPEPAPKNPSCARGAYTCCTNPVRESSYQSRVEAGRHEQTRTPAVNWHAALTPENSSI
jgi:hypothetical protein